MGSRRAAAALLLGLAAVVSLPGGSAVAGKPPKKPPVVSVADFYFGPNEVTIQRGGSVKWVWAPANTEPHDVHLKQGPRGLKAKSSYSTKTTAVTNARFEKTFPTPGTYKYICTIHPTEMKLTVTVKK
jgi:plastocyanin